MAAACLKHPDWTQHGHRGHGHPSACSLHSIRDTERRSHKGTRMSHDQNFKDLILDYPAQALAFFAADEAASLGSDARITPIRQEQLRARLDDRFRDSEHRLSLYEPGMHISVSINAHFCVAIRR